MLAAVILGSRSCWVAGRWQSTVNLTWAGSGDPRVSGYAIYYGGVSGVYTEL